MPQCLDLNFEFLAPTYKQLRMVRLQSTYSKNQRLTFSKSEGKVSPYLGSTMIAIFRTSCLNLGTPRSLCPLTPPPHHNILAQTILVTSPYFSHVLLLELRWSVESVGRIGVLRDAEACHCIGHGNCYTGTEQDEENDHGIAE